MKKIALMLMTVLALSGCKGANKTTILASNDDSTAKVQILLFHAAQRCITCKAIDAATNEVLDTYFAQQLEDSTIELRDIVISEKENEDLVNKYEAFSTSIYVNAGGKVKNLTNDAFSYVRSNPDKFKDILQTTITESLF